MAGPAQLCHGARRAVLCLLALPMLLLVGLIVWLLRGDLSQLILFLPGIIALPVFALVPSLGGKGVPLSLPTDAAKSAGRGLNMIGGNDRHFRAGRTGFLCLVARLVLVAGVGRNHRGRLFILRNASVTCKNALAKL